MLFPSPAYSFPQPLLQDPSHEIPRFHDNPARSRIPGEITHPRHVFRHRRLGPALGVAIHTLAFTPVPDAFMTFTSFTTEWTRE